MKILAIIFLVILFLIIAALFIPVSLRAYYDGKFRISLKILFFEITFPRRKNKKAKKQKNKKEKTKTDYKMLISQLGDVRKILPKLFKRALKVLTVKNLTLDVVVATDDPCDTAIAYGAVNAAVYPTVKLFEKFVTLKTKNINIRADYDKDKTEVLLDVKISTYLMKILVCLVSLVSDGVIKLK